MEAVLLLKVGHKRLNDLFEQLLQEPEPASREQLFDALWHEWSAQVRGKQLAFYPELSRYPELIKPLEQAMREHLNIDDVMKRQRGLATDEAWSQGALYLNRLMRDHLERQETELFLRVVELFTEEELAHIGERIELASSNPPRKMHRAN